MNDLKFKILLEDFFSSKLDAIVNGSKKAGDAIDRAFSKSAQQPKLKKSLSDIESQLDSLEKRRRISIDTTELRYIGREMRALERQKNDINKISNHKITKSSGSSGGLGMLGAAGAAGAVAMVGAMAYQTGKELAAAVGNYEKFQAVLQNTFNSRSDAKQAMSDIATFAAKTPFQINELTDSYVKLANNGFVPTMEEMRKMGDLAASRGKSFEMWTEALIDAEVFEMERLKEFGIRASVQGNQIQMTFKGVTQTIDKSGASVRDYLLSLGDLQGVAGGMNAISKTMEGRLSNLSDNFDQLKISAGLSTSGLLNHVVIGMNDLTLAAKDYLTVPVSQQLRTEQYELNNLIGILQDSTTEEYSRKNAIELLVSKYPELLGNLELEKASNEELKRLLIEVNDQYDRKVNLAAQSESVNAYEKMKQEQQAAVTNAQMQLNMLESIKNASTQMERDAAIAAYKQYETAGDYWRQMGRNYYKALTSKDWRDVFTTFSNADIDSRTAYLQSVADENKALLEGTLSNLNKESEALSALTAQDIWADALEFNEVLAEKLEGNASLIKEFQQLMAKGKDKLLTPELERLKAIMGWTKTDSNTGSATGTNNGLNSGIAGISGSSGVKNINITIGKLQDSTNIYTNNMAETSEELQRTVEEALLRAVNSANGIQN